MKSATVPWRRGSRRAHSLQRRMALLGIATILSMLVSLFPQVAGLPVPTAEAHNLNASAVYVYFDPNTQAYLDNLILTNQRPAGTPLLIGGDELGLIIKAMPDEGTTTGVGGYVTFYIPDGLQVLDAAYIMPGDLNADGITGYDKVPMKGQAQMPAVGAGGGPTVSLVGITRGPNILGATSPIVTAANANLGTLPGVYGDTGIFYSTAPETAFGTYSGGKITNNSGDEVGLRTVLGTTLNKWDAWQMAGYGIAGTTNPAYPGAALIDSNQRGNAPWGLANVVAGPQSGYAWEFDFATYTACDPTPTGTPTSACIDQATQDIGPWQRIKYPGSQFADDPPGANPPVQPYTRGADASGSGFDLTAGDLPQTTGQANGTPNAVRWAYGQQTQYRPEYMWIKVKVHNPTAILDATGCPKWTVDTFGGDAGGDSGGKDHIWRYYDPNSVQFNGCLAVGKPATRELVKVGDNYQYKIKLYNAGNNNFSTVQIQDTLPAGVTYVSAVPAPSNVSLPNLTWTVAPFLKSQMFEATVTVQAKSTGLLANNVCTTGVTSPGGQTINSCGKDVTVSGSQPLLRTGKSVTPTSVAPGGSVAYTINVLNVGSGPTGSPVVITEYLPAGFTYLGAIPGTIPATINGASVTATVGGTAAQPTFTVPAAIQAGKGLVLSFNALVSASTTAANYCNSYRVSEGGINQVTGALACVDVGGGAIGDTVYRDWDGDGIQDPEDEGLSGMTVNLYAGACPPSGGVIQTQTTSASGFYQFTGLTAGSYCVDPAGPAGYTLTQGTDPTTVTLAQSEKRLNVDFGYQPAGAGSIGDMVFDDQGNDGVFNGADVGIPNVTVNLYEDTNGNGLIDTGDALIGTTQTDGSGAYSFTGLAEGLSYIVDVVQTDPDIAAYFGGGVIQQSTADPQSVQGLTGAYTAADFGFYKVVPGSIGDQVFYDLDADGVFDSGEPGLANVDVKLYQDTNGNGAVDAGEPLLATTTTDASGVYSFNNLPAGTYVVDVVETDPDIPDSLAASIDPIAVTLGVAQVKTDVDFPFVQALTKTVDLTSATPGQQLTYTIYPRYFGTNLLTGVVINDTIPAGTTYVAGSIAPGAPAGEAVDADEIPDGIIDYVAWDLGSNDPSSTGYSGGTAMCPAASPVTVYADADTWLRESDSLKNFGIDTALETSNKSNDVRIGLLHFNIDTSTLPVGSQFWKATLKLMPSGGSNTNRNIEIRELLTAWNEGAQNNAACSVPTNGATWEDPNCALAGDWAAGTFGSGDYGATNLGGVVPAGNGTQVSTQSAALNTLVNTWLGGGTNRGVAMLAVGSDDGTVTWYTRSEATVARRPQIEIYYLQPTSGGCSGTVSLADMADTYMQQDKPNDFFGTTNLMKASPATNKKMHDLLRFDVDGIPPGATLSAATLKVTVKTAKSGVTSEIHRMSTAWTEGTSATDGATWNDSDGSGGAGDWAAGTFGTGDYNATVVGSIVPSTTGVKTADVKTLVQGWQNGTFANNGLVLLNTGATTNIAEYRSREDGTAANRPVINVSWSIPPANPTRVNTMSASPLLVVEGDKITVKMVLQNSTASAVTNVAPSSLTVTASGSGAYSCATLTGPSPASQTVPANGSAAFTWTCTTGVAPTLPGNLTFSATASGDGGGGSGNATLVFSSQNTTNPNNALGAPDANVARINAATPNSLVLDLGSTLPQNTVVTVRMKYFLAGGSAIPVADVDSGTDGTTFTSLTTLNPTSSLADYSYTITQAGGARYLRVRARATAGFAGDQNIDVDAVSFTGGTGTTWASSSSESVIVTPPLTFKSQVNNPPGVPVATNQADMTLSFPSTQGSVCYVMADGFDTNDVDYLRQVDRTTNIVTPANPAAAGTQSIEAMTWSPDYTTLYAANANQFGTLDTTTGLFTAKAATIASAADPMQGEFGAISVADVDGLSFDPATGVLYGVHRREGTTTQLDVLIKIDPVTGKHINNAFGTGVDYIKIRTDLLATPLYEVDDISFDPVSGQMFAIANGTSASPSVGDRLVTINEATGAVTDVARITKSTGGVLDDVEGLSFYGDGALFATTGYHAATGDTNKLWYLDKETAVATERAVLGTQTTYNDYEAVACQGGSLSTAETPSNEVETALTASIGDRVWADLDGDGVQDAGEPGLAGVEVCATPAGGGATVCHVTDAFGDYRIYGLTNATSYNVTVTPATFPAGYTPTTATTLTRTATTAGVNDADFGLRPPGTASIGDTVWLDANNNGSLDGAEQGLPNVTVKLYIDQNNDGSIDGGDTLIQTTTTDANGLYQFTGLHPDDYLVQVDTASSVTSPYDGTTTIAAAMAPTTGTTNPRDVTITTAGQAITDADFGYNWTGSIGDYVWWDDNLDGLPNESPTRAIAGATVLLYFDADGNGLIEGAEWAAIRFMNTNASGAYLFDNLPPGNYLVDVYEDSFTVGGDREAIPTTPDVRAVTLAPAQDVLTADFGYYKGALVEGNVFHDEDRNGIFDVTEAGLSPVQVTLVGTDNFGNPVIATTTTDANGHYTFLVPEGTYTLTYSDPDVQAIDPTLDDVTTPLSFTFTAEAGPDWHPSFDFGVDNTGKIGDTVWNDASNPGVQDAGEPGLAGVTVLLYKDADNSNTLTAGDVFLAADVTDAGGKYLFEGLADGNYVVVVNEATLPADFGQTYDNVSPLDGTGQADISGGNTDNSVDFGYKYSPPGGSALFTISGRVYNDANNNNADDGETGFVDVDVTVVCDFGTFVVPTDSTGAWVVAGIPEGSVCTVLDADETDLPRTDYVATETPGTPITVNSNISGLDFGYNQHPGSISGTVCAASDGDGICQSGEAGLTPVTVTLTWAGPDGILGTGDDTTTSQPTDANGDYSFTDLQPGLYQIAETNLPNYTSLADADGGNPDNISLVLPLAGNATDQDFEDAPPPSIAVTKTLTTPISGVAVVSDTITFTIRITNTGLTALPTLTITDTYDAMHLRLTSHSIVPDQTTPPGIIVWNNSLAPFLPLLPQASLVITVDFHAEASTYPGVTLNEVLVTGEDELGVPVAPKNASDDVQIIKPAIGVAKRVVSNTNNGDGTYTVAYELVVENLGDAPLSNVQVTDDLDATFGAGKHALVSLTSVGFTTNASYNGSTNVNLLDVNQTLAVGQSKTISLTVRVTPGSNLGPYNNQATATGTAPGNIVVTDLSDNGTDPDPDGDNNANEPGENDPTPVSFTEHPVIGVAKNLQGVVNRGDGTYDVTYLITVKNMGDVILKNVQVTDNLATTFAGATFAVQSKSATGLTINPAYTGSTPNTNLLLGTDSLAVGATGTITVVVRVTPGSNLGPYNNQATGTGASPAGATVTDQSQDGLNPDPNGDGDPTNDNQPTPVTFTENPVIGVAKSLQSAVDNGNGTHTVTYLLTVRNYGDVRLDNVQVTDDLAATFAGATGFTVNSVSSSTFSVNPGYTGSAPNRALLLGTDSLAAGASGTITMVVTVTPGGNLGPYNNRATGTGDSPAGRIASDQSQNGTNPDPDNDGNPGNNSDPTPVTFTARTQVGVAKNLTGVVNNGDGTYDVTYSILVTNMGSTVLSNVQVSDNLATTYPSPATFSVVSVTTSAGLNKNPGYTGSSPNTNLLMGTDTLNVGGTGTITLVVRVTPGSNLGPYNNTARGTATGPGGVPTADNSQNGTNPDPDGDGDPTNNNQPTPVTFTEAPAIGIAKAVQSQTNNADGTFTVVYILNVKNLGDVVLNNVQVTDNLATTFAGATFTVVNVTSGGFAVNFPGYTGSSPNTNLLAAGNTLAVGATKTIILTVTVRPAASPATYNNQATATGVSPAGATVTDLSDDGTVIDPDGDHNANEPGENDPTPVTLTQTPGIAVVKTGPAASYVGGAAVYTYTVTNTGNVRLGTVTVSDDVCGTATYVSGDANNDTYLDLTETWLFTCSHLVQAGDPDPLVNIATARGVGPLGQQVSAQDDWTTDLVTFSLGDMVWLDDGDGIQQPGETIGLYNVPITISGTDVDGNPVNFIVLTDLNGNYQANFPKPGTYTASAPATFGGYTISTLPAQTVTLTPVNPQRTDVDFGYVVPTGLLLVSFTSAPSPTAVHLTWHVGLSEGVSPLFHVWRATPSGAWKRLTVTPVGPSDNDGALLTYAYADTAVERSAIYLYRLEASDGTVFGPWQVVVPAGRYRMWLPSFRR